MKYRQVDALFDRVLIPGEGTSKLDTLAVLERIFRMKAGSGTSIFHSTLLGRVLYEASLHPETQSCDCMLCKYRSKAVAREEARLLGKESS